MKESPVITDIRKCLDKWKFSKVVTWYSRLQCGRIRDSYGNWIWLCDKGTLDFLAHFINRNNELAVVWIEAKRADGKGEASPDQIEFIAQQSQHKNTNCLIIEDVSLVNKYFNENGFDFTTLLPEEL